MRYDGIYRIAAAYRKAVRLLSRILPSCLYLGMLLWTLCEPSKATQRVMSACLCRATRASWSAATCSGAATTSLHHGLPMVSCSVALLLTHQQASAEHKTYMRHSPQTWAQVQLYAKRHDRWHTSSAAPDALPDQCSEALQVLTGMVVQMLGTGHGRSPYLQMR